MGFEQACRFIPQNRGLEMYAKPRHPAGMMVRNLLIVLVIIVASLPAEAEAPPACPENAEQTLFNVTIAIETGQISDIQQIYNYADAGQRLCPIRPDVQGLAAQLFLTLAVAIPEPDQKMALYGRAYEAAIALDQAFSDAATGTQVNLPDGTLLKLYPYGDIFSQLESDIMPGLAMFLRGGRVPAIFEETPLDACPYVQNKGSGAQYEARGLSYHARADRHEEAQTVSGRLVRLRDACTGQQGYLTWALSNYHYRAAFALSGPENAEAALEHARASKRYAGEYFALSPDARGANEANNFSQISRMQTELNEKFPQLRN